MTVKYNQSEYSRVTELFNKIQETIKQMPATTVDESEKTTLLGLLNDLEQSFEKELQNKLTASFNIIKTETVIHGYLNFLLEAQQCIDILTHPAYSLAFKSKAIENLQETGKTAAISEQLSLKAGALFLGILGAIPATAIAAVPLIVLGGPIGIAVTVAFYLTLSAIMYKVGEKRDQENRTVYKIVSKFTLFNSEPNGGPKPVEASNQDYRINQTATKV